jgi:hypothetical protein
VGYYLIYVDVFFLQRSVCLKCYAKACQNEWHWLYTSRNKYCIYIYTLYISEIWLDMWQCEYISRLSKISKPLHGKSCLPPLSPSHQRKVAVGAAAAARLRPSPASCPARQRWEPLVQVRPKQLRSPLDLKLRLDVNAVNVVGIWPLRIIKGFFKHPMYDDILMKHYIDKRRFISWWL